MDQSFENDPTGGLIGGDAAEDYELLMNTMQVSVSKHILDEHFTAVWSNAYYYGLIRYPKEEYEALFDNRPDRYYPYHHYEEELEKIQEVVMDTIRSGRTKYSLLTRMPVKGGGHVWVQLHGVITKNKYKGYPIAYSVLVDVDDTVKMQQAQSITYNNIPGFVAKFLIRDYLHIRLLDANKQFVEFFGTEGREPDPQFFRVNVESNRDQIIPQMDQVKRGEHVRFLARLQNNQGKRILMQANGDCVDWIDGAPVYLLTYIDVTDLTELREMHAKLEEQKQHLQDALSGAQKANAAKRDFLSRMSHEIRTPLNAIIGMTSIAAAHLFDRKRIEDCLGKISFSSRHLLSLINDILDMAKIEDGKLTVNRAPFYLKQVLDSVTTIIYPQAAAQGVDFKVSVQDMAEEEFMGDSMRISQILINLLSNAVKFTPEGGRVNLDVRRPAYGTGEIRLRFTVRDTGRGMSREFVENRLFQAFEQENGAGGTGLGMPITKNLVELLNGIISVRSKPGEGSTFVVELPFERSSQQKPQCYPSMGTLRVLVIDDDPDDCAYAALLLEKFGVKAKWVLSGREAVEMIRSAYEEGESSDICLIDWQMPEMDGIETTRRIRDIVGEAPPIIILTAYDYSEIEANARNAGANFFLSKPLFASSLYNTLLTATKMGGALPGPRHLGKTERLAGTHILVAEDNDLNLEIAVELLELAGARVSSVGNGQEALDWFAGPEGRDCGAILMDIQMPVMDGYQAARAIRASGCPNAGEIPIVAMTANAFREDVESAMEAGMNAHVAKPIDIDALYRTLEGMMERAGK
ncbi:response regulator [Enterocloster lavalensis]|uniref:response regulator n=1 Tax=Enterocloster lavalensis TaxID=460384 RepID=UPI002A8098E3|nr:response regulator [Enterocloster lavalensis]